MQKVFIIFFLYFSCGSLYAISTKNDSCFSVITTLSARYLNYNCSAANDSVISICKEVADWCTTHNNYTQKFQAEQVAVNALCLQGHIDEGIKMAKEMYETAKQLNHSLGKALALQAIGATYMYTGQYTQALATFSEARPTIFFEGDSEIQARTIIQELHCCMHLEDTAALAQYLTELNHIIPQLQPEQQNVYLFYRSGYETMLNLKTGKIAKAGESLDQMLKTVPMDQGFNAWRYFVQMSYYKHLNENQQTLAYLDSILIILGQYGHSYTYRNTVYEKAELLEKTNDTSTASEMYSMADSLTSILDMEHYTQLIEDLHIAYYIDQASIENAKLHNKYLSYILLCSFIGIIVFIILIITVHKRNKQLTLSRERLDKMRQATADSIQSKSIFLSNMSHDLRTPLNAIVGFSDILTKTEEIDPELKEQCRDYIKLNSDLLMKLVNDIIDFSTLKEAEIKFDFWKYDVVAICRSVVKTVAKVKKTEAELTFTSTVEHLEMETDSERLQQVLINLLTNAAKFTKAGYIRLQLDFNKQTNEAIFTVEDTGCGIPLEKQARIFERFEKLHESVQGVGLGLSICKLIISHVNGKIWIDSTYTEGARFVFTHPIHHISKTPEV